MLERNEEGKRRRNPREEGKPAIYVCPSATSPSIVKRTISLSSASRNHLKHGEARRRNEKALITGTSSQYPCTAWPPSNLYLVGKRSKHWRAPLNPHIRFHGFLLKRQCAGLICFDQCAKREDRHGERGGDKGPETQACFRISLIRTRPGLERNDRARRVFDVLAIQNDGLGKIIINRA